MKKIIILITLVLCSFSFASNYNKFHRISDMKKMADGLTKIQNGFIYRCSVDNCIIDGANSILDVIDVLKDEQMKEFLPKDEKYAYKFGEKSAKMIKLYVEDLKKSAKKGNMHDALEDYNQTLKECMSCHLRVRK